MTKVDFNIDDPFAGMGEEIPASKLRPGEHLAATVADPTKAWPESCPACRGSGRFMSWSGRVVGQCFKCKGKGSRTYKSSPEDRRASREKAAARRDNVSDANWEAFKVAEPEVAAFLTDRSKFNQFCMSLVQAVRRWGSMTDKQIDAVRRMMERDRAAAPVTRSVDASAIKEAFDAAVGSGYKAPKVRLSSSIGTLVVSRAPAGGRNPDGLYVKRDGCYIGKVVNGAFTPSKNELSDDDATVVAATLSSPRDAAVEFGRLTGSCSCCGRELTDPTSVAAGIGPVCASRFGW